MNKVERPDFKILASLTSSSSLAAMLTHTEATALLERVCAVVNENRALLEANRALVMQASLLSGTNAVLRGELGDKTPGDLKVPDVHVPITGEELKAGRVQLNKTDRLKTRKLFLMRKIAELQKELATFDPTNDNIISKL